jgi:hypothetical protein
MAAQATAADYTLADGNSTVVFSPSTSTGMQSWIVDSQQMLNTQWFWYRVGSGAELPLNNLTLDAAIPSGSGSTGGNTNLYMRYMGAGYKVELTYILSGGLANSPGSGMVATVNVTNTSGTPLDFHLFQYADFNLSGADTIRITGGNDAVQTATGIHVAEVITTPMPSHYEAGLATDSPSILSRLTDGAATTLTDATGPSSPGNAVWAFEWDQSIPNDGTLSISKAMTIAPEPATLTLLGVGLVAGLWRRRGRFVRRD